MSNLWPRDFGDVTFKIASLTRDLSTWNKDKVGFIFKKKRQLLVPFLWELKRQLMNELNKVLSQ